MISTILRVAAVLASLVLLTSFSLFAIDQAGGASQQAQVEVGSAGGETLGPALHGAGGESGVRGTIDDVDRSLVSPVHSLAPGTQNAWGARIFELVCGLLIYGLLLGILARSVGLVGRHRPASGPPQPHF
jgi:hypothetical protein